MSNSKVFRCLCGSVCISNSLVYTFFSVGKFTIEFLRKSETFARKTTYIKKDQFTRKSGVVESLEPFYVEVRHGKDL